ncbi:MAG: restriction endonuclease subunit S [Candidatus Methanoperedenaceae archaeon]|nr:MAG: restriction endonuclease subunit S [Candidatus Methanoperedenaceae archaeon]
MEGYKNTEIGFLPDEWNFGRIDDFFEIQQGKQVSKSNRVGDNQSPFLRTSNIYWGKIAFEELDYMHFSKEEEAKYQLKKNDLLVCEGGDIGRTAMWTQEVENCYYQNHLHRLRAKTDVIDPLFILQWLEYSFVYGKVYFGRANVTTIPNLSKSRLSEFIIPQPPLPEQCKIAHVLSTVQKAIEQQDKIIRTTTELKKALMQKLFTEGTRGEPQKETEIGLVPDSWEVQPFENTGEVIYGIQASVANNLKPIGNKILTNKNITLDGKIYLEKINYFKLTTKRHFDTVLKKGDLLFNWRSGSKEHVGKTALFDLDEVYTHSSFILRIRVNNNHNNIFLYYYLNYLREMGYYQKVQTYSINAKFNKSAINAMRIALPKKDEQEKIADILTVLDKKLNNLINHNNLEKDLFKTLLHELMTGQRRVHELEFK